MAVVVGEDFLEFKILKLLGEGGMGKVYLAEDSVNPPRKVAIKVLRNQELDEDNTIYDKLTRTFWKEPETLLKINHDSIVKIFRKPKKDEPQNFFVMEYVTGITLAKKIRDYGPMPSEKAAKLFLKIATAIRVLHKEKVFHGDIKPGNIIIQQGGEIKLVDFGTAEIDSESPADPDVTQPMKSGIVVGTPMYMSPEQFGGMRKESGADIWAFGCCLYEALTGKALLERSNNTNNNYKVINDRLNELPYKSDNPILSLLRDCLEVEPDERLEDISMAKQTLAEYLRGSRHKPHAPPRPPSRIRMPSMANRKIGCAIELIVVSCILAIAVPMFTSLLRSVRTPYITLNESQEVMGVIEAQSDIANIRFTGTYEGIKEDERIYILVNARPRVGNIWHLQQGGNAPVKQSGDKKWSAILQLGSSEYPAKPGENRIISVAVFTGASDDIKNWVSETRNENNEFEEYPQSSDIYVVVHESIMVRVVGAESPGLN